MVRTISGGGANLHIGQGHISPSMGSEAINGLKLRFARGEGLDVRHVVIDGASVGQDGKDIHLELKAGANLHLETESGHHVRVRGKALEVDGRQLFDARGQRVTSAERDAKSPAGALSAPQERFPGVIFDGDLAAAPLVKIGPEVRIKPGARVELAAGLDIRGKTRIGADARVSGGRIRDSRIDGVVTGGKLEGTTVAKGGLVRGGELVKSNVGDKGVVTGGFLEDVQVQNGKVSGGELERTRVTDSTVNGGILVDMRVEKGSTVGGGVFEGFALRDRDVSGGVHVGRLNPQWNEDAGRVEPSDAFQPHVRDTVMDESRYGRYDPGLYRPSYDDMMRTYDPRMLGYPQAEMQSFGGYAMPPALMGAPAMPGIVANPYAGMGTSMMLGMGTGALLGMGMGAFGMGMYGLGMGTWGLGLGMGGLGLGGFNWFCW